VVARAQADKKHYGAWVPRAIGRAEHHMAAGQGGRILTAHGRVIGLAMEDGDEFQCDALVVTTGTFLNGLIHIGCEQRAAGRHGEPPSRDLAESIRSFGFEMGRLKTGTPPRLDRRSIDFNARVRDGSSWRSQATVCRFHSRSTRRRRFGIRFAAG
jgi:tRNA uridine 5-carboxymethylaminomethyl modification enzyme